MSTNNKAVAPVRIILRGKQNPDNETSNAKSAEYFVFALADQVEKWRSDKSIPLVEVVDSFDIFEVPTGGNTGMFERPSKQILETSFGTSNQDEIIHKILSEGKITNASDKLNKANGPGNSSRGAYQGRVD